MLSVEGSPLEGALSQTDMGFAHALLSVAHVFIVHTLQLLACACTYTHTNTCNAQSPFNENYSQTAIMYIMTHSCNNLQLSEACTGLGPICDSRDRGVCPTIIILVYCPVFCKGNKNMIPLKRVKAQFSVNVQVLDVIGAWRAKHPTLTENVFVYLKEGTKKEIRKERKVIFLSCFEVQIYKHP